ncbi:helix-turn-helix transcriptional regulator [Roseateles cellulosilyticus]|uniref:LuxR C-terminal-related transcriptional regulator n=1 Tax=Pelomonas cellulosilytica TaxID=2906762 RepID=A0ABS8XX20_9BURK|nr:LuxR C-terminal-related transcriptional regulator [Pelomonas sp. P8]MCE4556250.1 LuxR C-terminal-related transcriptional regulator [Pelomonas sp. P8]
MNMPSAIDPDTAEARGSLPAVLQAELLPRPALQQRLRERLAQQRLLALCAPAGYGKTVALATLLQRWLDEAGAPARAVSWFSSRPGQDVAQLCAGWCLGLESYDLPWRRSPQALVRALDGQAGPLAAFVDALVQALVTGEPAEGVLVVDDLQALADASLPLLLQLLSARLPAHWRLVMASRAPIPVAADVLQADALRFTPDEVATLLARQGSAAGMAERLWQATQGWPAAVSLWQCLHPGGQDAGALALLQRDDMFDQLARELLDGLPAAAQAFMLRCSVLPVWSAPRCAAVAHEPQAGRWLQLIEARGLFMRRAPGLEPAWLMHELFRDFLQARLAEQMPQELPLLLLRAADTESDTDVRVAYLLRAGMLERAALALMDAASGLLARGELGTVQRLLDSFPPEPAARLPAWQFVRGRLAGLRWDWSSLEHAMSAARAGFLAEGWYEMASLAGVLQAQADIGLARLDAADELLQPLRDAALSPAGQVQRDSTLSWLHAAQGSHAAVAGDITRMTDTLVAGASAELWTQCVPNFRFATLPGLQAPVRRFVEQALAVAGEDALPLRLSARLLAAWLALSRGDLAEMQVQMAQAQADAAWIGLPGHLQWSCGCLNGQLAALRGDRAGVRASMEAVAAAFPPGSPWRRTTLYFWSRMADGVGDAETVQHLLAQQLSAETESAGEWPFSRQLRRLAQALALLAGGDAAAGCELLRDVVDALAMLDTVGIRGYAAALLTLARDDAGLAAEAREALRTTLQAAACYVPTLSTLGRPRLSRLIALAHGADVTPAERAVLDAALRLLDDARRAPDEAPAERNAGLAQQLTSREIEVLARMAAGESNKVIAKALDLSPHTVKRHVANIFDKLAVSTRAQAAVCYQAQVA